MYSVCTQHKLFSVALLEIGKQHLLTETVQPDNSVPFELNEIKSSAYM